MRAHRMRSTLQRRAQVKDTLADLFPKPELSDQPVVEARKTRLCCIVTASGYVTLRIRRPCKTRSREINCRSLNKRHRVATRASLLSHRCKFQRYQILNLDRAISLSFLMARLINTCPIGAHGFHPPATCPRLGRSSLQRRKPVKLRPSQRSG